jgi:hypothetical protein
MFGSLVLTYLLLVIGTVYLASSQTVLLGQVSDKEASIGALEARYYSAIAEIGHMNPGSLGFVVPTTKLYARAAAAPALTRVGK